MIRRPPRSTQSRSSAASDVYKRQLLPLVLSSIICLTQALINEEFVTKINSAQGQWKASHNNIFKGMNIQQLKEFLGTKLEDYEGKAPKVSYEHILQYTQVPVSFDARQQWGKLIHPIRNQGGCGSCWAFGSSEAFSDRLAIATNGKTDIILSPQYSVSCDTASFGCSGGFLAATWHFFKSNGIPSEECVRYTSIKGDVRQCPNTCDDGSTLQLYKTKNVKSYRTSEDAKLDILTNGPVETAFRVYEDFMAYESGIYKYTEGSVIGAHAVKVLGWGNENGIKYWIAANSWTEDWGENGFFRIQENQCGFDTQMISGDPQI
eukprot:TRINITY_DN8602_c0_g1_i8.p1 TRINITY_DN8602_c0_g1~~TRINITY_DN8602_c0_g1_i8.p1  ORF type:complete len:320 (-),score=76.41 TRINITY_DN8602_c0_g1_i8:178-1137(-)